MQIQATWAKLVRPLGMVETPVPFPPSPVMTAGTTLFLVPTAKAAPAANAAKLS